MPADRSITLRQLAICLENFISVGWMNPLSAVGSPPHVPYASPESNPARFSEGFPSRQGRDLQGSPAAGIRSGWKR